MKKGTIIKSISTLTDEELGLINVYSRRVLSADDVYTFSVVLCDNDIDRDYERFTVEALFELEKLFIGKTGIFDHNPSVLNQTARIYSCRVESVESKKTQTNDEYFRLVAKAYIPKTAKNEDIILNIDSGIIKEVSVGCAVKNNLCSICGNDIHSPLCAHKKGEYYANKLCFGELTDVYDAYEFSFVAIPAQKNAGIIKSYLNLKEEKTNMKDIIKALKKHEKLTLEKETCKQLYDYICELKEKATDGELYKESLEKSVLKAMTIKSPQLSVDIIKSILSKLSIAELKALNKGYKNSDKAQAQIQLRGANKEKVGKCAETKNQFTI